MNPIKPLPPTVDYLNSKGFLVFIPLYRNDGYKYRIWPKGRPELEEAFAELEDACEAVRGRA
jgi:hypothetical protein